MALSYFTESEAPRDFRVSSTESDGHYTKCLLCYTVKRNFYCADCVKTGNFIHSSMPYSDRFSEKQAKLLRLKANRQHILDRCEKLLANKMKKDTIMTDAKQSRDKLDLLRLAIEQRKNNIDEKRKVLTELKQHNNELRLKLPRYQKRVSSLGKHSQLQRIELQNKIGTYNEQAESLAALRRSRIRQLTKYIFPVYMTYDISDSIEDLEFLGDEVEEEPPKRTQLHIVAPWINTDSDFAHIQAWVRDNKEASLSAESCVNPARRCGALLALAAQLLSLLAWTLDARLPYAIALSEYSNFRMSESSVWWLARRLCASTAVLCARSGLPPPTPATPATPAPPVTPAPTPAPPTRAPRALCGLHSLALAANTDDHMLGRVDTWMSSSESAMCSGWLESVSAEPEPDQDPDDSEPPEHLHWPETVEAEEPGPRSLAAAPAPAASLITSAAASIASMWRGWAK